MNVAENPFAHVTNPDSLSRAERDEYQRFWQSQPLGEVFGEIDRLNRLKWGDEIFDNGLDKTKIEVVNMETGEITKLGS